MASVPFTAHETNGAHCPQQNWRSSGFHAPLRLLALGLRLKHVAYCKSREGQFNATNKVIGNLSYRSLTRNIFGHRSRERKIFFFNFFYGARAEEQCHSYVLRWTTQAASAGRTVQAVSWWLCDSGTGQSLMAWPSWCSREQWIASVRSSSRAADGRPPLEGRLERRALCLMSSARTRRPASQHSQRASRSALRGRRSCRSGTDRRPSGWS